MKIDFDPEKSKRNESDRRLSFARAIDFDWETALYTEDTRHLYPERRFIARGYLDERLHVLCFSPIKNGVRIISFRKANAREVKRHEQETANQ